MSKKENIFQRFFRFERKHKIISLIIIILLTILVARTITAIRDPNIVIEGYELHHFHYGLILLIIVSLMLLYRRGRFELDLILVGIAIGLIIDELSFISGKIRGPIEYTATLQSAIIIAVIIMLIAEAVFYYHRKKKSK
jgi:hypothetical protein